MPDLTGVEDYSRFHVIDPAETAAAAAAAAAASEEEPNADSPSLGAERVPVIRVPSPDDFVDSPRDFEEAGLTDEGAEL